MKRTMKKLTALVLSVVMMLAMTMTAFAAKVTINPDPLLDGHTFAAYQIFKGTQAEGEVPLGDVEWGNGITPATFLTGLKADKLIGADFASITAATAADAAAKVADVIANYKDNSEKAIRVAQIAYKNIIEAAKKALTVGDTEELPAGYYLIVDETENNVNKNAALLQVTNKGDVEVNVKVVKPDVDKTVGEDKGKVDDYNIGDTVPFELTSTVPDTTQYQTYTYKFHDTMSTGLTYKSNSLNVKIGDEELIKDGKVQDAYKDIVTYTFPSDTYTFDVEIKIKTQNNDGSGKVHFDAGKDIVITYNATLNSDAVIGNGTADDQANWNKVILEYSNNPDDENSSTTTEKEVHVYTFGLDITKVDGTNEDEDGNPITLTGAEFVLYREVPAEEDGGDSTKEYVTVTGTALDYKVAGWTKTKPTTGNLKVDANGKLNIDGLDAGTYYLEETKAPSGYNLLKNLIEVEIISTYGEDGVLATLVVKVDGEDLTGDNVISLTTGSGAFDVENNQGPELPETGGMGTTLLYIAGILVMAAAVFYLAMSKRRREQ